MNWLRILVMSLIFGLFISCLALAETSDKGYKTTTLAPNLYCFENRTVNSYLIVGKKAAVLIDTGYGIADYYEACQSITKLPLSVVLTHGHGDHAGGVSLFPTAWIKRPKAGETNVFGDIKLDVIATPGHTPTSVSLFDRESGTLFVGDTINPGAIWLFLPESDLGQWLDSIDKLAALYPEVKRVLPGHGPPFTPEILKEAESIAKDIRSGKAKVKPGTNQYESTSFVIKVK
jgi:glyoxylase-like metal-dependent hydrolase (beta-lactamase superfamily II)